MSDAIELDPAAIMAKHARSMSDEDGDAYCEGCYAFNWPCDAYRLAETVRRVEEVTSSSSLYDEAENRVVPVTDLRAALAGEGA